MSNDLLLCPFCGGKAHMSEYYGYNYKVLYDVICNNEHCRAGYLHTDQSYETEQEAIDAWNRRNFASAIQAAALNVVEDYPNTLRLLGDS